MRTSVFITTLLAAFVQIPAQDPPEILWPVTADPPPVVVRPEAVTKVAADELLVVASVKERMVVASPDGFVTITKVVGPVTIFSKFAGEGDKGLQLKTYDKPFVYVLTPKASGRCEIIIWPGDADPATPMRNTIELTAAGPAPKPPQPVDPDDDDDDNEPVKPPGPPAVGKLQVMIIEEQSDRAKLMATNPSQHQAMLSVNVRQYCKTHCVMDGTTPDFRIYDKDLDVSGEAKWIQQAFAEPRPPLPALFISNGVRGIATTVPKTEEEFLKLLKEYGGE